MQGVNHCASDGVCGDNWNSMFPLHSMVYSSFILEPDCLCWNFSRNLQPLWSIEAAEDPDDFQCACGTSSMQLDLLAEAYRQFHHLTATLVEILSEAGVGVSDVELQDVPSTEEIDGSYFFHVEPRT